MPAAAIRGLSIYGGLKSIHTGCEQTPGYRPKTSGEPVRRLTCGRAAALAFGAIAAADVEETGLAESLEHSMHSIVIVRFSGPLEMNVQPSSSAFSRTLFSARVMSLNASETRSDVQPG